MEVVHDESLALFQPPNLEKQINEIEWMVIEPKNDVTDEKDIEFLIPPLEKKYIDLSRSYVRVNITSTARKEGKLIYTGGNTDNHRIARCFQKITLKIGNENILDGVGENYPAKDDFEQYLIYHAKTEAALAFPTENISAAIGAYAGVGSIYYHLIQTGIKKPILNQVPITILIEQSPLNLRTGLPEGLINSTVITNADHKIVKVTFLLCTIDVEPEVIVQHNAILGVRNAIYPYWETRMKTYGLDTGILEFRKDDIFDGDVPSRLLVGVMPENYYYGTGDPEQGMFRFDNENKDEVGNISALNKMILSINGQAIENDGYSIINNTFIPSYDDDVYVPDYSRYFETLKMASFNISSRLNDDLFETKRRGNTTLTIGWDSATRANLILVLYARFPKKIEIDKVRNVTRFNA